MIQVTLSFTSIAEAVAALSKLDASHVAVNVAPEVASAKPGKPSAAKTAPSLPTAEAAPSTPAPSADAPEPKAPEATPQAADAPSASPTADTPAFEYATLQKAVNVRIAKHGKDKLLAIAKKHGGDTFKALTADAWAAAYEDVIKLEV